MYRFFYSLEFIPTSPLSISNLDLLTSPDIVEMTTIEDRCSPLPSNRSQLHTPLLNVENPLLNEYSSPSIKCNKQDFKNARWHRGKLQGFGEY